MVSNLSRFSFCLVFGFAGAIYGQTGTIQGVLVDPSGAAVPNAKVTATDAAKQVVARETVTDTEGHFFLRNLLPSVYILKGEATGFKGIERTGLQLDQNQTMDLGSVALQVGQTTDAVTVEAAIPLVETSTANKSFVITDRQVTQLNLNGRDFQSLMRTLPGVVSNDTSDFRLAFNNTDAFNTNGLRGSANNVFLDGTINTDVGANDGQYTQISLDAVGEFKVQTSTFNAEYGRNPGVLISINTKSGGSNFHGTLYEFFRNNAMDARFPFDTTGRTAKLQFNQYGGNLSGPIIIPKISPKSDKKLFFFFNYEGTRAARPIGGTFVDVPHPDLLNGDLSRLYRSGFITRGDGTPTQYQIGQVFRPGTLVREANGRIIGGDPYPGNIIPKSEWAKNAPGFLNVLRFFNVAGDPGTPGSPELVRHSYQQQYGFEKDAKVLRVDYAISPRMNFFFRWADDAQQETQALGIFATLPSPIYPQFRKKPGSSWSYNFINTISPTMTNEFIFGYNRLVQLVDVQSGASSSQFSKDALGFNYQELYSGVNLTNRFPRFNCGVGSCNYAGFPSGWQSDAKQFAFTDNFSWTRGKHSLKFGAFFNFNLNGQQPSWTDVPNLNFGSDPANLGDTGNTFANMLLGNYLSVNQTNGRFYGAFKFYGTELYAQDSWKVNRKLTLEFGMRWQYLGPTFTYGEFLQNYFDPSRYDPTQAVRINTQSGVLLNTIVPNSGNPFNGMVREDSAANPYPGFARHRFNNWGPRFGFAYDPFGDGKTVIRGGGGIFYERIRQNANNFDGLGNPPLSYTPTVYSGNIDNLGPQLVNQGVRGAVTISAFDQKGQIPTIYSWSFGIQRELGARSSLDVSYVGNMGRYLQYRRDINQLPLGTTQIPGLLSSVNGASNALRPYLGYTTINFTEFGATSNYNALQLRISRRFAKGFTGNLNYTWSKAFSIVDNDTTAIGYAYDRRREYGPAAFDRTHIVTADFVYDLPFFNSGNGPVRTILGGWQVNGIARFWSGNPATVTANGNLGTLGGTQRADYLGGSLMPATQDRDNYFNWAAFARPVDGNLGNTGKSIIRLPGINQWDLSLFKNFRIKEHMNFQFRFETFNSFNHTQWAAVNTGLSLTNPGQIAAESTRGNFGRVTSTRDPRSLQLALKFLF